MLRSNCRPKFIIKNEKCLSVKIIDKLLKKGITIIKNYENEKRASK